MKKTGKSWKGILLNKSGFNSCSKSTTSQHKRLLIHKKEVIMKNLLCFSVALLSCLSIAMGQRHQDKISPWPEKSRDHLTNPMQSHVTNRDILPGHPEKMNLFNPKSLTWNWDTIVTYDTIGLYQRHIQTFDLNGNVLTYCMQQWETNAWVNDWRNTYTYDANGNMLTSLGEEWQNNAWVNDYRWTYTYDANGNMLTDLRERWQTNVWVNYSRNTYTYDANGNMLTDLREDWQNNTWVNDWRNTYTYDLNGNMLSDLREDWQTNAWVNDWRNTYTYDANGNMLSDLREGWQTNTWVNRWRDTYSYDANGNMLTILIEDWQNNAWVNDYRWTYTYDANGNVLTGLWEQWQTNSWENLYRFTFTYDTNGNMLTYAAEAWQINAWVNYGKLTWTYDANGNSVTGKYEVWQSGNWEPGIGLLYLYSPQQDVYYLMGYRYEASFTSFISGIAFVSPTTGTLSVSPNPANEKIIIELSEPSMNTISLVVIYGMDGRELVRQQMKGSRSEINVSSLPGGMYCIRVSNSNANWFGRFTKN